jgi:exosome complex RNA-binding protein Rrp4
MATNGKIWTKKTNQKKEKQRKAIISMVKFTAQHTHVRTHEGLFF